MFVKRNILDTILSVFALGAGAVAIVLNDGLPCILCGVVLLIMGTLGLVFGNW